MKKSTTMKNMQEKEGMILKLFKTLKKFISKEFLWVLFIVLLALPLTLMTHYFIKKYAYDDAMKIVDVISKGSSLFTVNLFVNMGGIYLSRAVAGALATLSSKPKS
ncbi:hypothetical protein [Ascidiimonas sp. W6]|uniref:hypothetical protein n=1 Tax=Ascidiimonas meishanensis TaxID=3128903 RepID=UPI0030EBBCAC